ncbi:efflux RND transporter periplasmic adaptor subunit [bacterium]|nr:efflux RND transporter periplasmic adaptor subunit [bacterium]
MPRSLTRNLIFAACTALLLVSCGKEAAVTEAPFRPVRYEKALLTGGSRVRTFSGIAQPGVESTLSFKVAGTVQRVNVNVGDKVRRGQVIASLDPNDYNLQAEEARAALAQAQAQLRNANASYERTMALYENNNASKSQLDQAQAGYESAQAQVRSIEQRLELAELQVQYTRLIAQSDGNIAAVFVDENENVSPGSRVVDMTSGGKPEVSVSVPEVLITQVKQGSPAKVEFPSMPNTTFDATVTEVGVSSTGFATTFPVTVQLNLDQDDIRPGMAAEVSFRFETAATVEHIVVPPHAVGEDHTGRYVFVVEPGTEEGIGITRRRMVRVGELTPEGLEILDGILEGELVVTAGVSKIVDGQRVKLL